MRSLPPKAGHLPSDGESALGESALGESMLGEPALVEPALGESQAVACGAVVVAAGAGTRLGAQVPKALVHLGGMPLVAHAVAALASAGQVTAVVVTAPAGWGDRVRSALAEKGSLPGAPGGSEMAVRVIEGDFPSRQASVAAGLEELAALELTTELTEILVHDCARPLASPDLIRRLIASVRSGVPAVVPGLPVTDTIRKVSADQSPVSADQSAVSADQSAVTSSGDQAGEAAIGLLDRTMLRAMQTPQAFSATLLRRAHSHGAQRAVDESRAATDDAGLVEDLGVSVRVIPGERSAMKITDSHDLVMAETFLDASADRDSGAEPSGTRP